jgi:hypothetical protein
VVARLRDDGHDPDLPSRAAARLLEGTRGPLAHRVAWSLGERYGDVVLDLCSWLPGYRAAFDRLAAHAEGSARLALGAGCSERTAQLIRHQTDPQDPVAGRALRLADEAS